jgi:GTP-binding protein
VLAAPVGTMIFDDESGDLLVDLTEPGQEFIAAAGGSGGWGNDHFKTSVNQAPRRANPGTEGEEKKVRLELKLMADVGLVGFPNAGKSTLISVISAARPKIADYPFTTLVPNLGVVRYGEEGSYVVADIPGLIEGAAEGKGLGHQFLQHIERTRIIVHLLDPVAMAEGRDPEADYDIINRELEQFSKDLAGKDQVVVLTKKDTFPSQTEADTFCEKLAKKIGAEVVPISAVSGEGLDLFINSIGGRIEKLKKEQAT